MKLPILPAFLAAIALLAAPAYAAKPSKRPYAIFAGKLICYNVILNATDNSGTIYYTAVKEKITRQGKIVGSATRNNPDGSTARVTISGGIKGKVKVVGKGKKKYATAKGEIVFSDGAKGKAEFNTRKLPATGNGPRMYNNDVLEINSLLSLVYNLITYKGPSFSYKAK